MYDTPGMKEYDYVLLIIIRRSASLFGCVALHQSVWNET